MSSFGSYGLDQCLDLVESGAGRRRRPAEAGRRRVARGHRHRACDAGLRAADRTPLRRGDGAAARRQLSPRRRLDRDGQRLGDLAPPDRRRACSARAPATSTSSMPTPIATPYDTGTFASTGTVVAGQAVGLTAAALRDNILDYAGAAHRHRRRRLDAGGRLCRSAATCASPLAELHAAGTAAGHRFEAKRKAYLSPRTTAFNVQGFRAGGAPRSPARSGSCTACTPPISAG